MRNLLAERSKYYKNFADSVYSQYRKIRYGIQSCKPSTELYIDGMRKEIVDYQANDDGEALTEVSIQHMGWLPVYYSTNDESCDYQPPWSDMNKYRIHSCYGGPRTIGMSYTNQSSSANLIEVNTGGCITRINLNPSIVINNNNGAPSYIHTQSSANTVWTITHNLGFIPNVWTVDSNNNNISGVINIVNTNTLTITFNTSVAGKAYLS
jgi:hypothetical protein